MMGTCTVDIWREVVELVGKQQVFHTLGSQRKEFSVVKIGKSSLKLRVGKGTTVYVSKKEIETAWTVMLWEGLFEIQWIRDRPDLFSSDQPAFLPAILAGLPFVVDFKNGRRTALRLKQSDCA